MIYSINTIPKLNNLKGFAFIDKSNHCFMIVYGENKRDLLIEYLKG